MKNIIFISVALLFSLIVNSQKLNIGKQSPFEVSNRIIFYDIKSENNLTIDLKMDVLYIQKTQSLCESATYGSQKLTQFKIASFKRESDLVKINLVKDYKNFIFTFKDPKTNYNYNDGRNDESYERIENIENINEPITIVELKKNPTTGEIVPTESKFAFTINKIEAIEFIGEALKEVNDIDKNNKLKNDDQTYAESSTLESDELTEAEFTGGKQKMYGFIVKNFQIPEYEPAGKMIAEITIEKDGTISKVKIVKGIDSETDKEFERVLKTLPKFQCSALKNGEHIASVQTIPFTIGSPTDIKNYEAQQKKQKGQDYATKLKEENKKPVVATGVGYGYGSGTSGGYSGRSGYLLGGNRKAISRPSPRYTCNEVGKVVVEVSVDRTGKTISAVAGVEGSTNIAKCLLDQAQIAAMNTKWEANDDAPEKQVGILVYNFNLN